MSLFKKPTKQPSPMATEAPAPPEYCLIGAMLSHPGKIRDNNEDTVAYSLPPTGGGEATRRDALLLVADGMGGHAAGEVASRIAAEVFLRCYFAPTASSVPAILADCFETANAEIFDASQNNPEYAGMGTTCTVIAVRNNQAWLAHVGDSRAYILRHDDLQQISEDHTLVAELVRQGTLTPEESAVSPERNVILKALGTAAEVTPTISTEGMPLLPDDRLLLCSDGLSDLVTDAMMKDLIAGRSPIDACQALIDTALDAGGHDNVSVGVFHLANAAHEDTTAPERPTRRTEVLPVLTGPP